MYSQLNNHDGSRPPRPLPHNGSHQQGPLPSLSHGIHHANTYRSPTGFNPANPPSFNGGNARYGHIQLRPHSAFLQPDQWTPPPRPDAEPSRSPYTDAPSGLIADDRVWNRAFDAPGLAYPSLTTEQHHNVLRGRASPRESPTYSSIPGSSRHTSGANRVVSPMSLSPYHTDASQYPHGPLLPPSAPSVQMHRSRTLDSPARSSLDPWMPSHSNRPLTRSPLLRHVSPDANGSGYWDGGRGGGKERVGPPPKAKLGGRGGKTYDELRAGDSRIVSAPARTPPARPRITIPVSGGDEGKEPLAEEATWGSKSIAVRLPQTEPIKTPAVPSPPAANDGGILQDVPVGSNWRLMNTRSPTDFYPWGPNDPEFFDEGNEVAEEEVVCPIAIIQTREKEVVVTVPRNDPREQHPEGDWYRDDDAPRPEALDAIALLRKLDDLNTNRSKDEKPRYRSVENVDAQTKRHPHYPSLSSSQAQGLSASASPFKPEPHTSSQPGQIETGQTLTSVAKLRPVAPPFEPSTQTRHIVTMPAKREHKHSPRLTTRRSVSDIGGDVRVKRLRADAKTFQPSRSTSGSTSQASAASANNPYQNLWLPNVALGQEWDGGDQPQAKEEERISPTAVHVHSNRALRTSLQLPDPTTVLPRYITATPPPFHVGGVPTSPSPLTMKRSASGRLRPGATSYVPTSAFTFRPPTGPIYPAPPTSHSTAHSIGSSDPVLPGAADNHQHQRSVEERAESSHVISRSRSPASRLHDLHDPDSGSDTRVRVETAGDEGGGQEYEEEEQQDESGIERLSTSCHQEIIRSGAPSPPSGINSRRRISDPRQLMIMATKRLDTSHLPTESFGLPSPDLQMVPDEQPDRAPSTETTLEGGLQPFDIFTPLINAFPHPPTHVRASAGELPSTPVDPLDQTLRSSSSRPFETADGSPLVPRRYLETPATPHKNEDVESSVPICLSPTPARRRDRSPMLDHRSVPSSTTSMGDESSFAAIPTFARSELKGDIAMSDNQFRNWVYPASPAGRPRPSIVRRFTFPIPSHEHGSLVGIASTASMRQMNAVPLFPTATESGLLPTTSARTSVSVEFPLRPENHTLTIVNGDHDRDGDAVENARPRVSSLTSGDTMGESVLQCLERIKEMLYEIKSDRPIASTSGEVGEVTGAGYAVEELGRTIADMKADLADRSLLLTPRQPDLQAVELQSQREILAELLDTLRSNSKPSAPTADSYQLDSKLSTIQAGQTSLLDLINSHSDAQRGYARDTQTAIEAITSLKEDLELRKSSEEEKDEIIDTLRLQAEEARIAEARVAMENESLKAKMADLEASYNRVKRDNEETSNSSRDLEEKEHAARRRADELEAVNLALESERDGLAEGLRKSFKRQSEAEREVDALHMENDRLKAQSVTEREQIENSVGKFEALATSSKSFQDALLAEMNRLRQDIGSVSQTGRGELSGLREDKRMLQNEVTELRKKTYEAASKVADADLRLASASVAALTIEADLRRSLAATEKSKAAFEKKLAENDLGMDRLKVEKQNMSMIATERSGAMRIMEVRNQALIQENVFWREFALPYDRREYRKYTQSQPFHQPNATPVTDDSTRTAPESSPVPNETMTPLTPINPTFSDGKGGGDVVGLGLEGTPDLSMSASTSAEGIIHVAQTPGPGPASGEGRTWWIGDLRNEAGPRV